MTPKDQKQFDRMAKKLHKKNKTIARLQTQQAGQWSHLAVFVMIIMFIFVICFASWASYLSGSYVAQVNYKCPTLRELSFTSLKSPVSATTRENEEYHDNDLDVPHLDDRRDNGLSEGGETISATVTSYCLTGTMANGEEVHEGAVANNGLPFGTKVEIFGVVYEVKDRMASWKPDNWFDLWRPDCDMSMAVGINYDVEVRILVP